MSKITDTSHVFVDVPAADLERVAGILLRTVVVLGLDPHDPYVLTTVTGTPSGFRMAAAVHAAAYSEADTPTTDPADPDHERGGSTVGAVAEDAGGAGVGGAPAPPRRPKRNRPNPT